ncbi:hypothetical protein Btru_032837 [Bulinus truncatus]|nr:hypothetical protein Btru_032837 [Bulinus truncatus]
MRKSKSSSGVSGPFERFRSSRLAENSKSQKDSRTHISFVGEMALDHGLSEDWGMEYQLTKGLKEVILNERHIKSIANCFENVFLIPEEISVHWAHQRFGARTHVHETVVEIRQVEIFYQLNGTGVSTQDEQGVGSNPDSL